MKIGVIWDWFGLLSEENERVKQMQNLTYLHIFN